MSIFLQNGKKYRVLIMSPQQGPSLNSGNVSKFSIQLSTPVIAKGNHSTDRDVAGITEYSSVSLQDLCVEWPESLTTNSHSEVFMLCLSVIQPVECIWSENMSQMLPVLGFIKRNYSHNTVFKEYMHAQLQPGIFGRIEISLIPLKMENTSANDMKYPESISFILCFNSAS